MRSQAVRQCAFTAHACTRSRRTLARGHGAHLHDSLGSRWVPEETVTSENGILADHRDYFARQGLDIDTLTNDDACARRLLEAFTRPSERMPGDLLRDIYVLDELSDEDGHERILEEAERLRIDLSNIPSNVCSGDFATLVLHQHRHLIRICHEKTIAQQVRRYYEYRSRDQRRFGLTELETATNASKAKLGEWFEQRKRTCKCETFVYQDGDEVRILITHGGLFRADGTSLIPSNCLDFLGGPRSTTRSSTTQRPAS
jgi:hypothetical protein